MAKQYQEVVINTCFGGFGLSNEAAQLLVDKYNVPLVTTDNNGKAVKGKKPKKGLYVYEYEDKSSSILGERLFVELADRYNSDPEFRSHPLIVKVVKDLGDKANGDCADLEIVKVPIGKQWHIEEYDGSEHVAEDHETWR